MGFIPTEGNPNCMSASILLHFDNVTTNHIKSVGCISDTCATAGTEMA